MEPIFVVTGATGHSGSVVAHNLLAAGQKVRAVGREPGRLETLAAAGAQPVVCDLTNSKSLAKAFAGAKAAYVMTPPDMASRDYRAQQQRIADSIASALERAGVEYAVSLSSVGAGQPEKTGPIAGLHYFEQQLNRVSGLNVLHLRPGYFMDNLLEQVGVIKTTGYLAGALRSDLPLPMIAVRDIGQVAAESLLRLTFRGHQTRELLGPRDVSMEEAARIIGAEIGKPGLQYMRSPDEQVREALIQTGASPDAASLILEMCAALNSGLVAASEARSSTNTTPTTLETFVRERIAPAFRGMASGR